MVATARALNPAIETVVRTHNEAEARLLDTKKPARSSWASTSWRMSMTRHVLERAACPQRRRVQLTRFLALSRSTAERTSASRSLPKYMSSPTKKVGDPKGAAAYRLVGVGLELLLDLGPGDARQERVGVNAHLPADRGQHLVLRNVFFAGEVSREGGFDEFKVVRPGRGILRDPQAAAHGLDAVDREHLGRKCDLQARFARVVLHVLEHVAVLRCVHVFARRVNAFVDAVEDAAHQHRPPVDGFPEFGRQRLDVAKGDVGPGAGAVEEKFNHGLSLCFEEGKKIRKPCARRPARFARSARKAPCAPLRSGPVRAAPCPGPARA
jgi:hypothetical protein